MWPNRTEGPLSREFYQASSGIEELLEDKDIGIAATIRKKREDLLTGTHLCSR